MIRLSVCPHRLVYVGWLPDCTGCCWEVDGFIVCGPQALALDLEMMTNCGGKERTKTEWEKLLAAAGFEASGWRPVAGYVNVISARPIGQK